MYKGKVYKSGYIIAMFRPTLELFRITLIFFVQNEDIIILLVDQINIKKFNTHYNAYEISSDSENVVQNDLLININKFNGPPICARKCQDKILVRLNEHFCF